ncbi:hypothetical protein V8G54_006768 [Vigna mungo]|uniref:Uncharacterized protein n=1 Tax=Vigna mungo TaxID=3915 RepID=A0AAQ3P262_VIGMU
MSLLPQTDIQLTEMSARKGTDVQVTDKKSNVNRRLDERRSLRPVWKAGRQKRGTDRNYPDRNANVNLFSLLDGGSPATSTSIDVVFPRRSLSLSAFPLISFPLDHKPLSHGRRVPLRALVPRSNRGFRSTAAAQCYYEDDKEEECAARDMLDAQGCKPKRGVQWVEEPLSAEALKASRSSSHFYGYTPQYLNPRSHLYHQIANALDHGKLFGRRCSIVTRYRLRRGCCILETFEVVVRARIVGSEKIQQLKMKWCQVPGEEFWVY